MIDSLAGVYVQSKSPYYWIRYYDQLEPNPNKRRKAINTKIQISKADLGRIEVAKQKGEKPELKGTPELRELNREFRRGLADRVIYGKTGVKITQKKKLSEGFKSFIEDHSVPGSKNFLKPKTLSSYRIAVDHFINANGDIQIQKYKESHYVQLLYLFEGKGLSTNSRSIYTRSLSALWKYFVRQHYTNQNIIEVVEGEDKDPEPIDLTDMHKIIGQLRGKSEYPHHYWIVYFMLLTGCRPSSAIMQLKEDINFKRKIITIHNVKTGKKKGKLKYKFPLYSELELLLQEMGVKQGDKGRLFDMYAVVPENYTWPLSFWDRDIKFLFEAKIISDKYTLKQIRSTTASFMVNIMKFDIFTVQKLLDHANVKITDKHYIEFDLRSAKEGLDKISYNGLIEK